MARLRGVNIGNWLVLEKWMKPGLFGGLSAEDETQLCSELGENAAQRLKAHRDSYITFDDFKWISGVGLNSVRIPIPHWIFGGTEPYIGCAEYLDAAMEWADSTGLNVLLDLHTAPGSQNGFDNGGLLGVCTWHTEAQNISRTVEVIEKLSKRYKSCRSLWGIELLNEPMWDVPMDLLRDYYKRGYEVCRRHLDADIAIVLHDSFRLKEWKDFMQESEYANVMLDTHFYQCFTDEDKKLSVAGHLNKVLCERSDDIAEMSPYFKIIIGEWSLGIDPAHTFKDMDKAYVDAALRAYGGAQVHTYETAEGWFFWSYKLMNEDMHPWDYRRSSEAGWLRHRLK